MFIFIFFINIILANSCLAVAFNPIKGGTDAANNLDPADSSGFMGVFTTAAGFETSTTVEGILATVISAFLGVLGIIFLILIITAGFKWMRAADKAEEINKAKDTITRAIIGLLIVASAYAITYFVFKSLDSAGNNGSADTSIDT